MDDLAGVGVGVVMSRELEVWPRGDGLPELDARPCTPRGGDGAGDPAPLPEMKCLEGEARRLLPEERRGEGEEKTSSFSIGNDFGL